MPALRPSVAQITRPYDFLTASCIACICLILLLSGSGEWGEAQTPPPETLPPGTPPSGTLPPGTESVPVIAAPPPPPQERFLTPIPRSFNWISREVRPNPLLEGLLNLREGPPRLFLSVSLGEEYSDNFNFGQENGGGEEYRTSVTIGTAYRLESGASFVSLANTVSAHYDARAEDGEIGFANVALNAGHQIGRLSLALNDSFSRDDDVSEASPSGIRRQRRNFLRNRITPQMRYTFSPLTAGTLAYTNTFTLSDEEAQDSAVAHAVSTGLQHRFSRVVSGAISYSFSTGDSQDAGDSQAHDASADLGYLIDRLTSLSLHGFGRITDRRGTDPGLIDSRTYGFSVGIRRQLTSFLGLFASIGPTLVDRDNRDLRTLVNWQASLDGALPISRRVSLTLTTQQGVSDTQGEVDDVGLVLSQSVTLSLNYMVSLALRAALAGSYFRTELLENVKTDEVGRKENFWRAGVNVTYAFTRTLSLVAAYIHQQRDSTLANADFDENRVTVTLSSSFTVF